MKGESGKQRYKSTDSHGIARPMRQSRQLGQNGGGVRGPLGCRWPVRAGNGKKQAPTSRASVRANVRWGTQRLLAECLAGNQRLENWNLRRAPRWPYFLRSFMRESLVSSPLSRSSRSSSGIALTRARARPSSIAPAWPVDPPPSVRAHTSHDVSILTAASGATTDRRLISEEKYSAISRLLMRILPLPGRMRTRATARLRRPVPHM